MKKAAIAVLGAGGVLFALGFIIWMANAPGFETKALREIEALGNSRLGRDTEYTDNILRTGRELDAEYRRCLFSSPSNNCNTVSAVPYMTIGGILLLVIGGGLFLFDRQKARGA